MALLLPSACVHLLSVNNSRLFQTIMTLLQTGTQLPSCTTAINASTNEHHLSNDSHYRITPVPATKDNKSHNAAITTCEHLRQFNK